MFFSCARVAVSLAFALLITQAQTGTARIGGVVLDDVSGQPVKGALVRVTVDGRLAAESAIADATGRFMLDAVPAGRVVLTATKNGYVRPRWKTGQPPQALVIQAGQQIANVQLPLRRGGAIAGTISSASRPELPGATVTLLRCVSLEICDAAHSRSLQTATTDDRGSYRFFGLSGGSYFVAVDARMSGGSSQPVALSSPEEIRLAKAQLAAASSSNAPLRSAAGPQPVISLVTFYPGTGNAEGAQAVEIEDGEERSGVNITAQLGTAARISGTVIGTDGQPAEVRLSIFPNQRGLAMAGSPMVGFDGRTFFTAGLSPGTYRIGGRVGTDLWTAESFTVSGQDIGNVVLELRPTLEISGKLVATPEPGVASPDLAGLSVSLRRADLAVTVSTLDVNVATTDASGAFVVKGLMPGRYAVTCSTPVRAGETWSLKSVGAAGRDVLDSSIEITAEADRPALTLTMTSRVSEFSGTVRDATGRPEPEYTVIAFPADVKLWVTGSRRVLTGPVAADGRFLLKGLPPGEYFLGLLGTNNMDDVDRAALTELSSVSHRIVIGEGESKRIDLQVRSFHRR